MEQKEENTYKDGVSVVIVTYNGSKRLLPTLAHLAAQNDITFDFEIVVVDNNSKDNTSEIAKNIWDSLGNPFELRIVLEPNPGTMFARKRGIVESQYRYMLYCDDDNWLSPSYVSIAYNIISSKEEIAGVGGKGIIEYDKEIEVPTWIGPYEVNFGTGPQSIPGDITDGRGCLYTAGAILDRKWLERLYAKGFKSSLTGRVGNSLIAGEDTELTYALKLIGGRLYYSADMSFQHYMPPGRINWDYLKRLYRAFGFAEYIISPYGYFFKNQRYPSRFKLILKNLFDLLLLTAKRYYRAQGEGGYFILDIQRKKGELRAMLNYNERFKSNITMIEQLQKSTF